MGQKEMVEILVGEGFEVGEREVARIRHKNGWQLRATGCMSTAATPGLPTPGRQWAHPLEAGAAGDGTGVEDHVGDGARLGAQGGHEDQSNHWNYGAAGLEPAEAQLQQESLDAMREAHREHRKRQLEAESDEKWLTKKRRRRILGYGHLPADPPGMPPRFPSETSLTEAKAILQLDKAAYLLLRENFYNMLIAENVSKKTLIAPEKWEGLKDQLVRESMHLRAMMWDPADMDKKRLAIEIICNDVTKRVRDERRKITLMDAKTLAGLNPDESKKAIAALYNILVEENFTSKLVDGVEQFEALKQRWIAGLEPLRRIAAEDPSDPEHARRVKAVNRLANDATRRYRLDYTRMGRVPPVIRPQPPPVKKSRAKPKPKPAEPAAATTAEDGGGMDDEAAPALDSPAAEPEMEPEEAIATVVTATVTPAGPAATVTPAAPAAPVGPPTSLSQPRKRGRPAGSRNKPKTLPHVDARLVLVDLDQPQEGQQPTPAAPSPVVGEQQAQEYASAQPQQPRVPSQNPRRRRQQPQPQPQPQPLPQYQAQTQAQSRHQVEEPLQAPPASSGGLAAFFRLHTTSTMMFPGVQKQWIAALRARTMAEVRSAALQKTPGGLCYKIEGMVKDGQGGELPLPVSDEGELETYLQHVDGSGAPTFCVRIVPGDDSWP